MTGVARLLTSLLAFAALSVHAAPKAGDPVGEWLKDPAFKQLYGKALAKSPVNRTNSWVYKDVGLATSQALAGQNGNTWVVLSTCANKKPAICRNNHIDIFYDPQNGELFAYLSVGNRVGWIGNERGPTPLEKKFFTPYLTAKEIR